jgi:hypothetical protein
MPSLLNRVLKAPGDAKRPRIRPRRGRPTFEQLEDRCLLTALLTNYEGMHATANSTPDTTMAPGPSTVWEMTNDGVWAWDRGGSGVPFYAPTVLNFFGDANRRIVSSGYVDVRIAFDDISQVFVAVALELTSPNISPADAYVHYGISTTNNPRSAADFHFDQYPPVHVGQPGVPMPSPPSTYWSADQCELGWNKEYYAISVNLRYQDGTRATPAVVLFRKLAPTTTQIVIPHTVYTPPNAEFLHEKVALHPVRMHSSGDNDPMWYIQDGGVDANTGRVNLYYQPLPTYIDPVHNVLATDTFGRLVANVATYLGTVDGQGQLNPDLWYYADQQNPQAYPLIAGNSQVFSDAVGEMTGVVSNVKHWHFALAQMTSRNDPNSSPLSHTTRARWYEFRDVTQTTISIAGSDQRQGEMRVDPDVNLVATYSPAIDYSSNGNMYVTYVQSSPTQFPSMYVGGVRKGAPVTPVEGAPIGGTATPGQLQAGAQALLGDATNQLTFRAGDYASAVRDPKLGYGRTAWVANEYAANRTYPNWNTKVAQIAVADNRQLVLQYYHDILPNVTPVTSVVDNYVTGLDTGAMSPNLVGLYLLQSNDYYNSLIDYFYNTYLKRPASTSEKDGWRASLSPSAGPTQVTVENFRATLLGSDDYLALANNNSTTRIDHWFNDILFRNASQADEAAWTTYQQQGHSAIDTAWAIIQTTEGLGYLLGNPSIPNGLTVPQNNVFGFYRQYLARVPDSTGLTYWRQQLQKNTTRTAPPGTLQGDVDVISALTSSQEYLDNVARILG